MYCQMKIRGGISEGNIWVCCGKEEESEEKAIVQERWDPRCHPTHIAGWSCNLREMSTLRCALLPLSVNSGWFITTAFSESTHEV